MSVVNSSSSAFDTAVAGVLAHEGGYVDDPSDPGGATHYGVTLAAAQAASADGVQLDADGDGKITIVDIKAMTPDEAITFYRVEYWQRYGYGQIADSGVAAKVLDLAVNMGAHQGHIIVQRALRATSGAVPEDGQLGPVTMAAINAAGPDRLLSAMRAEAAGFYRLLAATKPSLAKFLPGWLNRAYS